MSLEQHNKMANNVEINAQPVQQPEELALKKITLAELTDEQKSFSREHKESYYVGLNNAMQQEAQSIEDYKYSKKEMLDNARKMRNDSHILMLDEKWYSLFNAESAEMKAVKQSLAYLNQCLDKGVAMKDGMVDVKNLEDELFPAYRLAFDSCSAYLLAKDEQLRRKGPGKKRHSTGERRYNKVKAMLDTLRSEYDDFKIFADNALQANVQLEGVESVRDLLGEVRVKKATISRFMPEGNSSNVYRVKVEGSDGKHYYVKVDEKLLHEDVEGYVNRRLAELNRSKAIRDKNGGQADTAALDAEIAAIDESVKNKEISEEDGDKAILALRAKREELRLEGKIDNEDYTNGISFLSTIQGNLNGLTGQAKIDKMDTYVKLFAHDFDKFFAQRVAYNATIDEMEGDISQIDKLIAQLKTKGGQESQIAVLEKAKTTGELKKMSEWEWFASNLESFGISQAEDGNLFTVLQTIGTKKDGLSKLFTRSLGKELELFGQHAERSGLSKSDVLASNNTATSRLAGVYGFKDVVTTSFKGKLEFTEVGKTEKTVANVTFSEEAPGEELLTIMAEAQALQKQGGYKESLVKFSKNAIRQLNRLQVFDLMTLQTDRHWRNIKAMCTKKEGNPPEWVIDSIKCYDHDQSFGNKNLKNYFKDLKDPKTGEIRTQKEGFLSPIMMTVSRNSSLYRYAKATRMTNLKTGKSPVHTGNFFDEINMPTYNTQELVDSAEKKNAQEKYKEDRKNLYARDPWSPLRLVKQNLAFDNPKKQEAIREGMKKRNPGKEELVDTFFKNLGSLAKITISFQDFEHITKDNLLASGTTETQLDALRSKYVEKGLAEWSEDNDRNDYEAYAKEEERLEQEFDQTHMTKKAMFLLIRETFDMYRQLDLTGLEESEGLQYKNQFLNYTVGGSCIPGYYDYSVQAFFHSLKLQFVGDEDTKGILEEIEKDDIAEEKRVIRTKLQAKGITGDDLESKVEEELAKNHSKTVRVPAMLHMDRKAYNSILEAKNNPERLDNLLMDLNMTQDKKEALKARLDQIVADVEEAQKVLNEWADMQGLAQDDIRRKFLLDEEDYDKIESLTDMALDPGMSYYSAEDSQFMTGVPQMKQFMSDEAVIKSLKITNDERSTQRQKLGKMEGNYTSLVNNKVA